MAAGELQESSTVVFINPEKQSLHLVFLLYIPIPQRKTVWNILKILNNILIYRFRSNPLLDRFLIQNNRGAESEKKVLYGR
jgi:hypothetical protein